MERAERAERDLERSLFVSNTLGIHLFRGYIKDAIDKEGKDALIRVPGHDYRDYNNECDRLGKEPEVCNNMWAMHRLSGDINEAPPYFLLGKIKGKKRHLVVIDLDNKKGKEGTRNFDLLFPGVREECTWKVRTGSGGEHLYFWTSHILSTYTSDPFLPLVREKLGGEAPKKTGIDLLAYQGTEGKSSKRVCFCPPALHSDLKNRHTWITDPMKEELQELPNEVLYYWQKCGAGKKDKKETKTKEHESNKTIIQRYLYDVGIYCLSQAPAEEKDRFVQFFDQDAEWEAENCHKAWASFGYALSDAANSLEELQEMFEDFSQLFPAYRGGAYEHMAAIYGTSRDYTVSSVFASFMLVSTFRDNVRAQMASFSMFIGELCQQETTEQEKDEIIDDFLEEDSTEDHEEWIQDKNIEIIKLIEARRNKNYFYETAYLFNTLFCKGKHPQVGILMAHIIFAAAFQYEYSFKFLSKKGYISPNAYIMIFAGTGVGKQILFDLVNKILRSLSIDTIGTPKSPLGFSRQISGKKVPREMVLLIDEAKEEATFTQRRGRKSMDGPLKSAYTKLHDGSLEGHVSKEETEKTIHDVFLTCFAATSYDTNKDEFIRDFDYEHGIGNRWECYIIPPEEQDPALQEYYTGQAVNDSLESLYSEYEKKVIPHLKKIRNRFDRFYLNRNKFYEDKYPKGVNEKGEPVFVPIEIAESGGDRKKKDKNEEQALKEVINRYSPYKPARLILSPININKSSESLNKAFSEQSHDEMFTRQRYLAAKLALCVELGEVNHTIEPSEVCSQAVEEACELINIIQKTNAFRAEPHRSATEAITFQEKSDEALEKRVTGILNRAFKRKKEKILKWGDIKHLFQRIKKLKHKEDAFFFIRNTLSERFKVEMIDENEYGVVFKP